MLLELFVVFRVSLFLFFSHRIQEEPQPEDDAAQAKIDVQKRLAAEKFQKRLQERKAGGVTWAQEMSLKAAMATGDVPSDGSVKPASAGKWVPPSMRNRIAANGGEMPLPSAHTRDDSATVKDPRPLLLWMPSPSSLFSQTY